MAKSKGVGAKAERYENPLMPDERLRQMYTAMVQVRLLEEDLERRARRLKGHKDERKLATIRGEEAARASTALSLETGDLLSDCREAPGMDLLLGVPLETVRERARAKVEGAVAATSEGHAMRLPTVKDGEERLEMALGAGAALRVQGVGRVLLVYAGAGEVGNKVWKRVLRRAGEREVPVIFAVLPAGEDDDQGELGELARRARGWGVPGFPVDGADAIGLYRVMQESLLRARTGGGAVLIESVAFAPEGEKKAGAVDTIARLEELMLLKGAASGEWVKQTRMAFARRLGRARR